MPERNGLDAPTELRRGLPNVPLVLYSAVDDLSGQAKLIGFSEIVSKFDPPSLLCKKARALVDIKVGH